jgi:outer membrane protein insertion porin family
MKLKGLIFFDLGKGYDETEKFGSNIKYTTGFGFRWFSPLGPLKIDYGINLNRKEGESKSKIEFGFGSFF